MLKGTEHKCKKCEDRLKSVDSQPEHRLLPFICRKCNLKHYITIDNRFSHTNDGNENTVYIPNFVTQFTTYEELAVK